MTRVLPVTLCKGACPDGDSANGDSELSSGKLEYRHPFIIQVGPGIGEPADRSLSALTQWINLDGRLELEHDSEIVMVLLYQ